MGGSRTGRVRCLRNGMDMNKRITLEQFRSMEEIAKKCLEESYGPFQILLCRTILNLVKEVKALGGPVCQICLDNRARYQGPAGGLCALCDIEESEERRGERL